MRPKLFQTFLWKFLLAFLASLASLGVVLGISYFLATQLIRFNPSSSFPLTSLLRWIINRIGSVPVMSVTGCFLFLLFFFVFSRKMIRYIELITSGLQKIAEGDLSHRIPVTTSDELGQVARTVNEMTLRLSQSQAEERAAVQARNDLITGVSHDLRTPLTSVLGFLEYIEQDRYRDEPELRQYVSIAYEKSLVLEKLIDDLFEYTRVTSSDLPLQLERIDLVPFLQQLADEFVPALDAAGMACRVHAASAPLVVEGDPELLLRLFENLMTNAIRYGREGLYLDIEMGEEQGQTAIIFRNYGEPIPANHLPHLFERFYRVDASRSKETGGSGLGLAIARSIVELHGGTIKATSAKRKTEFTVTLRSAASK
ncbi:sensor histidine kinase [Paenibacillus nasutitermitis]|uniref:histidine kinase n=1 Tax=Paenibacillus nasutitermitis TaxID=1652958 RepID=A0A917DS48_9BACL|nr:HAMP domain-containing sensor histidine kinase [Paenibacillus nasutitermitis]GGD65787.1 two-component sensor histidine kinase [Paenibacillus nasutitermitis]